MFLHTYAYKDNNLGNSSGWEISEIVFSRNNLFVGISGSGKSRTLNSLWNVANFICTNNFRDGIWEIKFEINSSIYLWTLHSAIKNNEQLIISEALTVIDNAQEKKLFSRNDDEFYFNGNKLPKLAKNSTGIFLLKEESVIKPVYEGFARILRRNFFGSDLEKSCAITGIPPELLDKNQYKKIYDINNGALFSFINPRLYLLSQYEKEKFEIVKEEFKSIFNATEDITFVDGAKLTGGTGQLPVLAIKEKGVNTPIMLHDLSSGMQKVLLIITDILTLPSHSIYIIDEYENSLGVNAINFLPDFITSYGKNSQFITTSHHPYLINNIPVTDWSVFSRSGSRVMVRQGKDLAEKYKKSRQEAFVQLINDPLYSGI